MRSKQQLLVSLREGFEQLQPFDSAERNALTDRGQMVIRRVFGSDSPYDEKLSKISFSYRGPMVIGSGPEPAEQRRSRERTWNAGKKRAIALIDTMLEDLELGSEGPTRGSDGPRSNRVFVVHGHDGEMKHAVARTLESVGLEAIILHEKPNRGQTIIEKIERFGDVDFAVVLLSPDDTGYSTQAGSEAARPRARQNVILELGYFAGKLGRENVVALHRGNIEFPSDYDGVLYTPYDGDSGAWRNELIAELKDSGYEVSADDL